MAKLIQSRKDAHDLPIRVSSYVTGFVLSIALTLFAYFAVTNQLWDSTWLLLIIAGLAIVQLVVQLIFFLHLGRERGGSWRLVTFWFAVLVVAIVVVGSLWIMFNLNYNMMDMAPHEQAEYMHKHEGF